MEQHFWWLFALLQPLGFATVGMVTQHYKQNGTSVAMMRSCFVALAILPFLPFVDVPTSPVFYMATAASAVLAFIADSVMMNSNVKFGAGPTSRLLPISPLFGLIVWLIVNPETLDMFAEKPAIATGIIAAMLGCVGAMSSLRKCDVSRKAIVYLIPVIVCWGINDVMNKTAQDNSGFWSGILWYTFFLSCGSIIIGTFWTIKQKRVRETLTSKLVLICGFWVGIAYLTGMMGRNVAMVYTTNPAYVSIIASATPLAIILMHKIFNIEDKANIKAGVIFTISVSAMVYLVNML